MKPLGTGDPVRLGPYRVLGVLGEGGMGKVYFGRDDSGRAAAVKVLLPELAHDPHLAQRFLREAHTAQAVTSGGVARVLDARAEDTGSRPWIATEFLSGPTLDDAVHRYGPFGADGVRALAASLAATLRDIHAAGLVHRDLKPANIVLTAAGPRVIDFGIARPEHGLTLTTTGQVPVTPGYGAPEQVLGRRVGPAADVFSLGAVLAYAATGQRTFDGTHVAAVQYEVVHGEPRLDAVPPELRQLIAPCLAKDPAHRPSPGEIAGAFAPPPGADRVWRTGPLAQDIERRGAEADRQATVVGQGTGSGPSRRRLLRTALAAGGVLAASGAAGGTWWMLREEPRKIPAAGAARDAEPLSINVGRHGTPPGELWGPLPVAAGPVDGVVTDPLPVLDVVVFAAAGGGLAARLTTDGKEKWRLPGVRPAAGLVGLPDNRFATAGSGGALLSFEGSTSRQVWSVGDADTGRILAADASAVYLVTRGGKLRAVDTAGRKVRWTVPLPEAAVKAPGPRAAVASGRLVVFGADGDVVAVDTASGATAWRLGRQAKSALQPLVVKDVVYLGGRSLTALDIRTGAAVWKEKETEATEAPQSGAGGWGPAASSGDRVFAMDGTALSQVFTELGGALALDRSAKGPVPHTPPHVEAGALWVVQGDGQGVSAHNMVSGRRYWNWSPESRGPWGMSGAGNRVFLVNDGKLTAMPTVEK
ncbi:protein kinase domain-containing protein [Streptomyces xanthophaeus]|uniref:protein kinase domain-containing protein n=1 Tax=Streptomyces xanthophaeus TaxID=67385 RepID=UPI002647AE15|nr:PQQ-binding-like beta-propeller repeat protein [Streptomyces xanthophaeus]WKD32033.1 serine/threonine-protein kinase [Streptomyces xanthophaeus]